MDTRPTPFNSLLWTANIEVNEAYLIGYYSFFDKENITFTSYPKNHELLGDLKNDDKVKRLINITEGWYTITKKGDSLYFNDLRFGLMSMDPQEERFAFTYELESTDNGVVVTEMPKYNRDAKKLLYGLWSRIWGN